MLPISEYSPRRMGEKKESGIGIPTFQLLSQITNRAWGGLCQTYVLTLLIL